MKQENEIIVYQPDSSFSLEVRIEEETVWLTQAQMTQLFQRERSVITRHINNVFQEGELTEKSNVHFLHIANSDKPVKLYSLDVIISVGYRVKSIRGTQFRQWANQIIKDHLLKGYSINQRFLDFENRIDNKLYQQQRQIDDLTNKVDFVINSSLKPKEGIFFDGQIFDAYKFIKELIQSAEKRIVLIDNYVDESVLTQLDSKKVNVSATIYTSRISASFQLDIKRHDSQYPRIEVKISKNIHDRFLIIDNDLYHIGASIKDLGKKLFAFSKMGFSPQLIMNNIQTT